MRHIAGIIFLLLTLSGLAGAQGITDSNLPIIIINTDGGVEIQNDPRVYATMKIIYRGPGERNYLADQDNPAYLNYNGRIDIEVRGSSSQDFSKKQYGFTTRLADNITNNNVSLLGMPAENDWILNGMVFDTARIRDFLCYNLSRQLGNYASRASFCELIINNDYRGLYMLVEKIKSDDNRVDVLKIGASDNSLPELSGGYITKADKVSADDPAAWTMYSWFGSPVNYIHVLPKPENATSQQTNLIRSQFKNLETTAKNGNTSAEDGYPSIIDVPSFIDFIIINELAANVDVYSYSTFFHKDRNGKLRAGPIWDLDLTFGNDLFFWGLDRSKPTGWYFQDHQLDGSTFWRDLFYGDQFRCYLSKRWNELTQAGAPLNLSVVGSFIDQTVAITAEGIARDYVRWGITKNHQQLITAIKSFLNERISWITSNIGPYSACSNVYVPPLVITKIMYHPATSVEFPDSEELEFIEITNNGDVVINLTGICFSGTGLVFQFPVNSTLLPGSKAIIASNAAIFRVKYGFEPYGQFTRHLSDKSQNLVLTDAFGNIIDNVSYYDSAPWSDADGNGYYLKLADPDLDNNIASNWTASNDIIILVKDFYADNYLLIYPNPVADKLTLKAQSEIKSLNLFNLQGHLLITIAVNCETFELDMSGYAKGTYIVTVITSGKVYAGKIIKQ